MDGGFMANPESKGSRRFPRARRVCRIHGQNLVCPIETEQGKVSTRTLYMHLRAASALLFWGQEESWSYFNFGLVYMGKLIRRATVQ